VELTDADLVELAAKARRIVAANSYLTLATVDADGHPWVSPVYFTPDGSGRFLWVSSPTARHSRNLAERPDVALVVFDSTVAIGRGEAVYVEAQARLVAEADLDRSTAVFASRSEELAGYTADEVRPPAELRLYEAVAAEASVLLRGADPRNAGGIDTRVVVRLD